MYTHQELNFLTAGFVESERKLLVPGGGEGAIYIDAVY